MDNKRIIGNYELIKMIGAGSFATVWLGRHTLTGLSVAIKIVNKNSLISPEATTRFNREIALLKQLHHPFIAELFEVIDNSSKIYNQDISNYHNNNIPNCSINCAISNDSNNGFTLDNNNFFGVTNNSFTNHDNFMGMKTNIANNIIHFDGNNISSNNNVGLSNNIAANNNFCGGGSFLCHANNNKNNDNGNNIFVIMEHAANGSLLDHINLHGSLDENRARRYFCQLISAMDYLHNHKYIAHRDLKAENILLDKYDNIRLIDFGLSNEFSKDDPILKTACGSPAYAAPEMIQGCPYTKAADIWSVGVVLFAMVAGCLPFDDSNVQTILQKVVYTDVVYPPTMSRSLIDLLKRLLVKNPEKRLTISQIIQHPWFAQSEFSPIVDLNTSTNFSSPKIDKSIADQMKCYGLDVSNMMQYLMLDEFNVTTAVYKMLKKCKFTESIHEMMDILFRKRNGPSFADTSVKIAASPSASFYPNNTMQSMMAYALNNYNGNAAFAASQAYGMSRRMSRPVVMKRTKVNVPSVPPMTPTPPIMPFGLPTYSRF